MGEGASSFTYDAFGKLLSVKTQNGIDITSATSIANLNPLRYRGYVYDNETGLYYLQSRYYDPTTCRFINADGYVSTGQGITGNNMFAYCNNNPVSFSDPTGCLCEKNGGGGYGGGFGYAYDGGYPGGYSGYVPSPAPVSVPATLKGFAEIIKWISRIYSTCRSIYNFAELVDEKADIKRRERKNNSAVYYGAEYYGHDGGPKKWNIKTEAMNKDEAINWITTTGTSNVYGKRAAWGIYTRKKQDAILIASCYGEPKTFLLHDKNIGCYDHYHLDYHLMGYTHFHFWFGDIYHG